MRILPTLLLGALLLTGATAALAGDIHPALEDAMISAADGEMLSVIVHMEEQADIATLNAQLKTSNSSFARRNRTVIEALQAVTSAQDDLKAYLDQRIEAGAVAGYKGYWISNLLVVQATLEEIEAIAGRADVSWVENNFHAELIEPIREASLSDVEMGDRDIGITPGLLAIRASEVWYNLGITGAGTIIGSMDTGVDGNHPALNTRWRGTAHPWQECWLDVLGSNTQFPNDGNGHGTHTTGTMTGLAPNDSIGVAPEAQWIACNAINQGVGSGFDNDVIDGFEWFANPDGDIGTSDDVPDVVQNSWRINEGFGGNYVDCDTRWWAVIDNCEAAGVVTTWSAGNEGPGSETIGSPPDRATTLTSSFSIGAVSALNPDGFPFQIASWSSRGPSGCDGLPPENLIKPEVVAPGVNVYSSVPGGGYSDGYSGTSMAGPHVAGVVALMRQANPDLDVDFIKTVLMETARDEGAAGEDNTYGWGFIDAYEAVLAVVGDFGTIQGTVSNGSWFNLPLIGATVEVLGTGFVYTTDENGEYSGLAPADSYTLRASMPGFSTEEMDVVVNADQVTEAHFQLNDIAGPNIDNVDQPGTTTDIVGPYVIGADIQDFSEIAEARLYYRYNNTGWTYTGMGYDAPDHMVGWIPGVPANTQIDYYVWAKDNVNHEAVNPFGAPDNYYTLYVTEEVYSYDAEDPGDPAWTIGAPGDDATTGVWIRDDPVGTVYNGTPIQMEDDHTVAPGVECYVTGNGAVGGAAGDNDVDGGCTTLISAVFDLSDADFGFVKYWRWFGQGGNSTDDEFAVDVSGDGGASWTALERVPGNQNSWQQVVADIGALLGGLTSQVQFRFVACDNGSPGLVEAGIDDFAIEVFTPTLTDAPDWGQTAGNSIALLQNRPNPFLPGAVETTIQFALEQGGQAKLQVFDISGRLVKVLAEGSFAQGTHTVRWDGRDGRGHALSSGVYFYRLQAAEQVESRRLVILR